MTNDTDTDTDLAIFETLKLQVTEIRPTHICKLASHISELEVINPATRFTEAQIISILNKTLPSATGITGNEFKTFIETCMVEGANPILGDVWGVKIANKPLGIWFHYEWVIRKVRERCPSLTFGKTEWGDEKGNWSEVWPYDPYEPKAKESYGTDKQPDADESKWIKKAPFIGRIWYKTADMVDFEPVTLYWHERAKFDNEWKKQPLHQMEKCLKVKAARLLPNMSTYYIQDEMSETPNGQWEPGTAIRDVVADKARVRSGDLEDITDKTLDNKDHRVVQMRNNLGLILQDLKVDKEDRVSEINGMLKPMGHSAIKSINDLPYGVAQEVLTALEARRDAVGDGELFKPKDGE